MHQKLCSVIVLVLVLTTVMGQEQEPRLLEQSLVSYTQCRVDSDCITKSNNSFCFNNDADVIGVCKCLEGYEMVSRNRTFFACLGPARYGEPCEKSRQCQLTLTENAECASGQCQCKNGNHLYTDNKCYVSVLLDEFCRSDGNCWMSNGSFANCVSGRCTCRFDRQVPTEDKMSCMDSRRLGELCTNDQECSIVPNAVCRVNCKCGTGFTLSRDQKRCLKAATEFFEICEENDQCSAFLQGSICKNGTCACEVDQHGVGSRCIQTRKLGEGCSRDGECQVHPSYVGLINCVDEYCRCSPGAVNETIGCGSCVFYCNLMLLLLSMMCSVLRII